MGNEASQEVMVPPEVRYDAGLAGLGTIPATSSDHLPLPFLYLPYTGEGDHYFIILVLHDYNQDLHTLLPFSRLLQQSLHADVFVPEYAGYGIAEGRCSAYRVLEAAKRSYHHIRNVLRRDKAEVVIYGKGLGTGAAMELATLLTSQHLMDNDHSKSKSSRRTLKGLSFSGGRGQKDIRNSIKSKYRAKEGLGGVILVSPFSCLNDIGLTTKLSTKEKEFMNNARLATHIHCPALVVGSLGDVLLPPKIHCKRIVKRLKGLKAYVECVEATHDEIELDDEVLDALIAFIDGIMPTGLSIRSAPSLAPSCISESPAQIVSAFLADISLEAKLDAMLSMGFMDRMSIAGMDEIDMSLLGLSASELDDFRQAVKRLRGELFGEEVPSPEETHPSSSIMQIYNWCIEAENAIANAEFALALLE